MSRGKEERENSVKHQKSEVDDYLQSVIGLHAFAMSCAFDETTRANRPESRWGIPRKMSPPPSGDATDEKYLTPDAVIQVTDTYGVIAEMKKHFPERDTHKPFEQVASYAVDLKGWWTTDEKIQVRDLVLLTGITSRTAACDAYAHWTGSGNRIDGPFAIVEFGILPQGQEWFYLRRAEGHLTDSSHDEALRRGKPISPELISRLLGEQKFMDSAPPRALMLLLIYQYALPLFAQESEFEAVTGAKYPVVTVSAQQVRDELERQFCRDPMDARSFTLPRLSWVQEALELLVAMDMGIRVPDKKGTYRIRVKPRQRDLLRYFASRLHDLEAKRSARATPEQVELFREAHRTVGEEPTASR